jgi:hypothetical protein
MAYNDNKPKKAKKGRNRAAEARKSTQKLAKKIQAQKEKKWQEGYDARMKKIQDEQVEAEKLKRKKILDTQKNPKAKAKTNSIESILQDIAKKEARNIDPYKHKSKRITDKVVEHRKKKGTYKYKSK